MSNKKGFTLFELIIVVIIIGVVMAISIPFMKKSYEQIRIENHTYNLQKILQFARQKAVLEQKIIRLNIDPSQKRYWLTTRNKRNGSADFKRLKGRYGRTYFWPEEVLVRTKKNYYEFLHNGEHDIIDIVLSIDQERGFAIVSDGHFESIQALALAKYQGK
jgi:prepilin-type N-terminal cleavage/methylation domain-containing protein